MSRTAPRPFAASVVAVLGVPLAGSALVVACGGGSDNLPPPPPPPQPTPSSLASVKPAEPPPPPPPVDAGQPPPPMPAVTLSAGAASPDPAGPLPSVKITAPTKDQVVAGDKASSFGVKLDVKNWATATGSSHVHLILDNKPYKAIYDTKSPVMLSELSGGAALDEGQHVLVAFASRANHESVKTKDAMVVVPFWVGKKGTAKADIKTDTTKPMLVYSRPKGDYKGELANHVLVDFQIANVTLAEGKEHVKVTVSGPGVDSPLTADATKFGPPFFLENLRNGSYTIKLELLDAKGELVPGPWNATTRTINVDRDAPADPAAAHGAHDAADAGAPAPATSAPPKPSAKPAPPPAPSAKPPAPKK